MKYLIIIGKIFILICIFVLINYIGLIEMIDFSTVELSEINILEIANIILNILIAAIAIITILQTREITNKQIENQNKEANRPYLSPVSMTNVDEMDWGFVFADDEKHSKRKRESRFYEIIEIKNWGKGIAKNIKFIDVYNKEILKFFFIKEFQAKFSTFDLPMNYEDGKISFEIEKHLFSRGKIENRNFDLIDIIGDHHVVKPVMVFYSDLYNNIYSTIILIAINYWLDDNHIENRFFYFSDETKTYSKILNILNTSYNDLFKLYGEEIFELDKRNLDKK